MRHHHFPRRLSLALEWFDQDPDSTYIDPDTVLDTPDPTGARKTFIYYDQLYWMPKGFHYNLVDQTPALKQLVLPRHNSVHEALKDQALLGRYGALPDPVVSFWDCPQELIHRLLAPCLQALLQKHLIPPDAEIHHPKLEITTAQDYLNNNSQTRHDPELERRAELARQLHLMPSDQKQQAMKELGVGGGGKPNAWRNQMRKAGIPAGSSHHFGTSESLLHRLERLLPPVQ